MEDLIMRANNIENKRQQWKVKHNLVYILVNIMLNKERLAIVFINS